MASKTIRMVCGIVVLALASPMPAQAPKEVPVAVPVNEEPRHHFAFENDVIRAFRVEVAPHDRTLLHRHDRDYFFISLGAADIMNAVLGRPEVSVHMDEEQVGFAKGGFAHVAENRGATTFRNFTIEFKRPQTKLTNRCAKVDVATPLSCPKMDADGGVAIPEFETEEVSVALLRIKPGRTLALDRPLFSRLLMPIGEINVHIPTAGGKKASLATGKETWLAGGTRLTVVNTGDSTARVLSIAVKGTAQQ